MQSHLLLKNLTVLFTLLVFLSACRWMPGNGVHEMENPPAGFTFTEGTTAYPHLYRQAIQHLEDGEYTEAQNIYADLIEKEPENSNGYIGLGSSLHLQGHYQRSQQAYDKALSIEPDSVEALIGLGSSLMMQGEYAAAEDHYARALELKPGDPNAHWGMALALESLGQAERAAEHLKRVIEIDPGTTLAEDAQARLLGLGVEEK